MRRSLLVLSLAAVGLAGCAEDPAPIDPPVPAVLADTHRQGIGLLQVGDHLYWADAQRDDQAVPVEIRSLGIDDAESTLIATVDDEHWVRVVAADPATGTAIWTQGVDDDLQLWIAEGTAVRQLPVAAAHAVLDGATVYSERVTAGGIEVVSMPRAGGEPTVIATVAGEGLEPKGLLLDPAGTRLLLAADDDDGSAVWSVPVAGGEPVMLARLTSDLAGETSADVWAALVLDGDSLLVPTRVEGMFRVPLAGGAPVRLGIGDGAESIAVIDDQIFWVGGDRINRGASLLGGLISDFYTSDEIATIDGALIWVNQNQILSLDAALLP